MNIEEKVTERYNSAINKYGIDRVVAVFATCSEDYLSSKTILLPSLDDIINRYMVAFENHHFFHDDNKYYEYHYIQDIRSFLEQVKNKNEKYIDILSTPYCAINPKYSEYIRMIQLVIQESNKEFIDKFTDTIIKVIFMIFFE